ncbi:uncharacterized protein LOC132601202 [Lycium barbarum]|uniref:uncharacterized protein LOC132601202 n=1 Tax=Lycium barbarum TaxID=112863 RepID=UPI00293EE563|nr:uncharacterized protein LOC132601202 [Lycium barbarum]
MESSINDAERETIQDPLTEEQSTAVVEDLDPMPFNDASLKNISERCHKFFTVLKNQQDFEWTPECKQALQELKRYLSSLPLLSKPNPEKKLFLYLVVLEVSVSAALVREEEGKQSPIYYISKTLLDVETRYPYLEKLALALIHAAKKLRHYFKSHPIVVVTTFPLRSILHRPELSSRLAKWAIELSEFDITYQPRNAIKSQILADFVANFSSKLTLEVEKETITTSGSFFGIWTLYTDGATNESGSRLGLVLKVPSGEIVRQAIKFPKITNNEVEYEVVAAGLKLALKYRAESIKVHYDSQLVVNQVNGTFSIKEPRMQKYQTQISDLFAKFKDWGLEQVPRESNAEADGLAKLASAADPAEPESRSVIHLLHLIGCEIEVRTTGSAHHWRNEILDYLQQGTLPTDKKETRKLRVKEATYCLVYGELYRRTFGAPLAKCLGPTNTEPAMQQVHSGYCGNHSDGRSLA